MSSEVLLVVTNLVTGVLLLRFIYTTKEKRNQRAQEITLLVTYDENRKDGWFADTHKITTFGQLCIDGIPVGSRFILSEQSFEKISEENVEKTLEAVKPLLMAGLKVKLLGAA